MTQTEVSPLLRVGRHKQAASQEIREEKTTLNHGYREGSLGQMAFSW